VSPRSAEFFAEAQARLRAAQRELDASDAAASVSLAYYAMLYAARAALSEEDLYAKTHRGTWDLFWQTFAASGRFEAQLADEARGTAALRQLADYEAKRPGADEAAGVVELAQRFVDAVGTLIGA
jgi:uncharacterized protein (UPF0332 family)